MVEHNLAKVGVASSSLVFRSKNESLRVSETFFVACTSYEKWARRHSDKVFALPTEQFQRSELEKIFCEKSVFCNKSASIRASKWL